ncbi:MAG TPA: Gfo/Idh/MocA family oxidoreductase [Dehalococcoidia bacterium]|nr:Gfo/Idh/MocA family oxidoreductase [Dehalococcoidia bacterium]
MVQTKPYTWSDVATGDPSLLKVAVIGTGYWGPNLVRNFFDAPGSTVSYIADLSPDRLSSIGRIYPSVQLTTDFTDVLKDTSVDAVCLAVPASLHYKLALKALQAGKHVWVEKPLTLHKEEAAELNEEAKRRGLVLMVDHTFVYTPAVRRMRQSIESGELGDLLYYDSVRVNLGLYQHDVNVLWDLGIHDVSVMDYLLPFRPTSVKASGASLVGRGNSESIAYVTLNFAENFLAHFHVNWLAPVKIRLMTVCGSQKMIVYDDNLTDDKIRLYDRGITVNGSPRDRKRLQVDYRAGDMYAPKLDRSEALQTAAKHFIDCIVNEKRPITDGEAGGRAVAILEAAQRSLASGGAEERIIW